MSALRTALEEAGIRAIDWEFDKAIAKYLNAGGTIEEAQARLDLAKEKLLGSGPMSRATDGQKPRAASQQPEGDDEGPASGADEGQPTAAPSSPLRRMTLVSQSYRDEKGVFRPKPQTPGAVAAAARVAKAAAVTVLDSFKVRDGRGIGDVYLSEVAELRASNIIEASVLLQIQRNAVYDPTTNPKVRDVVKVGELQRMIQRAAEVADAS